MSRIIWLVTIGLLLASLEQRLTVNAQCTSATRPQDLSGSGVFTSPDYPANYPSGSDCQWRITSTSSIVALSFGFYYTEPCCDIVNIYDGNSMTSPLLVRLYGNVSTSLVVESTQGVMYVRFTSDSSLNFQGFTANYVSTTPGAGTTPTPSPSSTIAGGSTPTPGEDACLAGSQPAELTGLSGSFVSPNHPGSYPNSADCQWRISASTTEGTVTLDFTAFHTESCCDFAYIYDGNSTKEQLIATLSGTPVIPPGGYVSSQRYMYVKFTTDGSEVSTGFSAIYTTTRPEDPCSAEYQPMELTGASGTFTSVNFPAHYHNNADCQWRITAVGTNAIVTLDFTELRTESCCDFVFLYNGVDNKSPLIASLSGTPIPLPGGFATTQRYMYVRLTSDATATESGFSATFTSVTGADNPCSTDSQPLELTGDSGSFTTENYPNDYQNLADCQWRILSPNIDSVVVLDFNDFRTESCCDLTYIYDGNSTKSPLIVSLSGTPTPLPGGFTSTQPYMYIRFTSDPIDTDRGFSASYRSQDAPVTACGSILHVVPNDTNVSSGWGPMCYISQNDASYVNTPCRDLIQNLHPDIGDYNSLLAQGGNFGCHPLNRDDYVGSETACFANYQHGLTLASVPSATKLMVCIRLPTSAKADAQSP